VVPLNFRLFEIIKKPEGKRGEEGREGEREERAISKKPIASPFDLRIQFI